MSHAMLLRLFLSPGWFNVHHALSYLSRHMDHPGISYYICSRLKEMDTQELREQWLFFLHLLITRPSSSRALESFVHEVAGRSTHIAMITLWSMQSYLDVSQHGSQSFVICQRTLHRCHEIIFGDLPAPVSAPYSTISLPSTRFLRRKIKSNAEPAFVGIGTVLAGIAMPELTRIVGDVALEQGFVDDGQGPQSIQGHDGDVALGTNLPPTREGNSSDEDDEPRVESTSTPVRPKAVSRRSTISAAQTTPALPAHLRYLHRSRNSEDPLGQLDYQQPQETPSPFSSSPSMSSPRQPIRGNTASPADQLLQRYDSHSQSHLLRSQYCRSEVQFLLTLENISNRLLVIPKPARVSALRAELTSLNHQLPAEVCMPMWCSSSDSPRSTHGGSQPHHRIVRIPPGESVVLNSAERAPYLLLIEILNDDLDFDPARRSNKEVLKKIVLKEAERKGASKDLITFNSAAATPIRHKATPDHVHGSGRAMGEVEEAPAEGLSSAPQLAAGPPTPSVSSFDMEEEVDLVEQLYGTDHLRSRTMDLTESIVLPLAPKNRELEIAAWSRSSAPPSPWLDRSLTTTPHLPPADIHPSPLDVSEMVPKALSLEDYGERMKTAAIMLAQLNASMVKEQPPAPPMPAPAKTESLGSWIGTNILGNSAEQSTVSNPIHPSSADAQDTPNAIASGSGSRLKLQHSDATAIRNRIMKEMIALEEERMERMKENQGESMMKIGMRSGDAKSAEDEGIIRRELNKADPSAVVFSESWATKKARIRHGSPYGHLANWDCCSVIVKTGGDLRQEQLAVQLIQEFEQIWKEENIPCWVRYFRILITGASSGLVETITDSVSIHSIKKAEYARRFAEGRLGHVSLMDHFTSTYGDVSSAKFARAQRNFAKSLAGYSVLTYLLQIKDRHNGNILLDREGHLVHIDFGFILSNSPGNMNFEAAPFKLPLEYIEVLGGVTGESFLLFKRLFLEGFEAVRKHCDRIITLVELMQKDSALPCFAAFGDQTANQLRDRFQPALSHSLMGDYVDRLIDSSLGSNWTRLYDSYQYYSQSIL